MTVLIENKHEPSLQKDRNYAYKFRSIIYMNLFFHLSIDAYSPFFEWQSKKCADSVVYPAFSFQSVIARALAPVIMARLRSAISVCGYANNDWKLIATVREQ